MLPTTFTFVDIETTGLSVNYDRIIDIGIIRVENDKIVSRYETLINPEKHIPPEITVLTGIRGEQLENAPVFSSVAKDIWEYFNDSVLVAHNASFDYGFLRSEFRRLELPFSCKKMCTLKLARFLFPQLRSHGLDSLINNFNITCSLRHRALSDIQATVDFFFKAQEKVSADLWEQGMKMSLKKMAVGSKELEKRIDELPEAPGVYMFYGETGVPLYVGKSTNIKNRVLSHFSQSSDQTKERQMCQQTISIEYTQTEGELSALLLESKLIKKMQPLYNRLLRQSRLMNVIKQVQTPEGYETVTLEEYIEITDVDLHNLLAVFPSRKAAKLFLTSKVQDYGLCEKLLGLEKTSSACFSHRLGKCKGACLNEEMSLAYNMRFAQAFADNKIKPWPFRGTIKIENVLVDKWCVLSDDDTQYRFDVDAYKILLSYLRKTKANSLQTISETGRYNHID